MELDRAKLKEMLEKGKRSFDYYDFFNNGVMPRYSDENTFSKMLADALKEEGYKIYSVRERFPPTYLVRPKVISDDVVVWWKNSSDDEE